MTITNQGAALAGWRLEFRFPDDDQRVWYGWGAGWSQRGQEVEAASRSWNGNLARGASTTIGFNASWWGRNPEPAGFTLNGQPCAVA